jgi:hypothetical protein
MLWVDAERTKGAEESLRAHGQGYHATSSHRARPMQE